MERVSFVMRVKDGKQAEYIRRHREVWPEVLAVQRRAGVTKMAIYMKGAELFLYMEVENYARAVRMLNDSPEIVRWEEYMAPIMENAGDKSFDPANAYPDSLPEVFFWEPADEHERQLQPEAVDGAAPSPPHFSPSRQSPVQR